jgi:hypothetical protein
MGDFKQFLDALWIIGIIIIKQVFLILDEKAKIFDRDVGIKIH